MASRLSNVDAAVVPEDRRSGASPLVIEAHGLVQTFPGVRALDGVDFEVRRGEVHALVGQNGAGKSTLVKVLTGVYIPDDGRLVVDGQDVRFRSPNDAVDRGISIVHQDSPLVAQFDVMRNVFLGREISRRGVLDFGAMRSATADALRLIGAQFGPDMLVRDLSVGQREQVAIATALAQKPSVLILDEPTASLGAEEVDRLFQVIRSLRDSGVTVVYISHHLDEVFRIADRITVLRDGRRVGTMDVSAASRTDVIRMMVGRELGQLYPKEEVPIGELVLEVKGLRQGRAVRDVSFVAHRGEILGLAGLVGAGRTETALTIFGALQRSAGEVLLDGRPIAPRSPHEAKGLGIALIPEDRRAEGLVTDRSVRENLTLASLDKWSRFGLVRGALERAAASGVVASLNIATPSLEQLTRNLSGGNQQKIVIGRWFAADAKVYLFDEPTTGVDVGAKVEIYREMTALARAGAVVIVISSDFDELAGMCDRVVVLKKGRVVKELKRGETGVQEILHWATGGDIAPGGTAEVGPAAMAVVAGEATSGATAPARAGRLDLGFLLGRGGVTAGMLAVLVLFGIGAPNFFAPDNVFVVLKQGSTLALLALALTIVLVAGGFDMSVGGVSQLATNLSAGTLIAGFGTAAAVGIGAAAGFVFGVVNAILIVLIGIPPFVGTLGTMFVAIGLSFAYNGGQALTLHDQPTFFFLGQGTIGPIPFIFVIVVVLALGLHFGLKRTAIGLRMYAVGENPAAARLRGVSRGRALFIASVIGGLLAGVTGVMFASYAYGASALATGLDFLISALAAAFLGSVLSKTGELDVIGTVVAAIFIQSINNGLILNGASNLMLPGIQGAILIISILFGVIRRREIGQVLIF